MKDLNEGGMGFYFWTVHMMAMLCLIGLMYAAVMQMRTWTRRTPVRNLESFINEAGECYHARKDCIALISARGISKRKACKKCARWRC